MSTEDLEPEDYLLMFITESGFKVLPAQAIIDALSEMEQSLKDQLNVSQKELDQYLDKLENLVGKEEALHLSLDEIVSWIKALRGF